jgi:hypothetical protein
MQCYCCDQEMSLARKVKLRLLREYNPDQGGSDSAAYQAYREEMTFRWTVICLGCYTRLNNDTGEAEINGREFGLAGSSRGDKAAVVNEAGYRESQRGEAEKLGIDLGDEN